MPHDVSKSVRRLALPAVVAAYLALAGVVALNKLPWCDEGWYGAPAANLALTGSLGTPGFYDANLPGVRDYTYWEMPGFILLLAGWFKVAGVGLLQARGLTMALGALFLVLWSGVLARLGAGRRVRVAAATLIGLDYFFVLDATYARSDMLSLVFFAATLFSYLALRESKLDLAIGAACACAVATGLTHPNAGLLALIALGVLAFGDRHRFRWHHLVVAGMPFVLGAALWGLYIFRAPDLFAAQFSQNADNRFSAILNPVAAVAGELGRYQRAFGLGAHSEGTPAYVAVKAFIPLVWLAAVVGCVRHPAIRTQRHVRTLLTMLGLFVLYYTFLEGTRTTYYLIWLVPVFSSVVAVWAVASWNRRGVVRLAVVGAVLLVLAIQSAASLAKARQHQAMRPFDQVVEYLRAATPGDPFTASIEFGYAFGFFSNAFIDDVSLGAWSRSPTRYVVIDERYREYLPTPRVPVVPEVLEAGRRLREACAAVLDVRFYTVYRCD